MIQVIERTFSILALLSPERGTSLDNLTRLTGLNKGTLCNILKSLVELGYVQKDGSGSYIIRDSFYALALPSSNWRKLAGIAEKYVHSLACKTQESGVIARLDSGGKVEIIAQHQFNRSVMVSEEVYKNLSLYESVTGRILLSYSSDEILKEIIEKNNYPEEKWNNVTNWTELQKTISSIRSKEIAVMENKRMEIKAFAVPVLDAENKVLFSLGLTVPLARLNEKAVIKALRETQKSMVEAIAHLNNKK